MMMNVKESENERMERMLQTLNKRGAENYEKRRQQTIKEEIERERIEKEQATRETKKQKMVITTLIEDLEKERKEKEEKERIKLRRDTIIAISILGSMVLIGFILDPAGFIASFIEYIQMVGLFIGLTIIFAIIAAINSMPHYTKPHRYIVHDVNSKNNKVVKGWHTTTYVPKNKR